MVITVYGKAICPQCTATESWLKSRDIPYVKKDIEKDPEAKDHLVSTGIMSLPLVEVVKGKIEEMWGGFQPQRLRKLIG